MQDIQQQVREIASRAQWLVRWRGLAWFLATVVLGAAMIAWIDYLVRFEDFGIRAMVTMLLISLIAWSFHHFLRRAWQYRCSDLQAATGIEQRFPALEDQLSSAVMFAAEPNDHRPKGSDQLRHAVISQTTVDVEQLDLASCLQEYLPLRALVAATIACLIVVTFGLLEGPSMRLAARRLLIPWGQDHWPRRHVLEFVSPPTHLMAGQDFEIKLIDANGILPNQVEIHFRLDDADGTRIQSHQMQPLGDTLFHRRTNVTHRFRYRATGGDDQQMAWVHLTVVKPPEIVESEFILHPPTYTGHSPRTVDGSFRALQGTKVAIRVRVDKTLTAADLETNTDEHEDPLHLVLDDDRRGFSLSEKSGQPWTITDNGVYGLRMFDETGMDTGVNGRWRVEVDRDHAPTVSLIQPSANQFLSTRATTQVKSLVKDDLAVRAVRLHFRRSDQKDQSDQSISLWKGPDDPLATQTDPLKSVSTDRQFYSSQGVQHTVRFTWDLASLAGIEPGDWIDYYVTATDYRPQTGQSSTRRLTFMSDEQIREKMGQRQSSLLAQILEVAEMQREARLQLTGFAAELADANTLDHDAIDRLQSTELNQRQVRRRLENPIDGIGAQIDNLLSDLRGNQMNDAEAMNRLIELGTAIRELGNGSLPSIDQGLIAALKIGRESLRLGQTISVGDSKGAAAHEMTQFVNQASETQAEVIQSLEKMLGQLSQWDRFHQLGRDLGRLRREQIAIQQQTVTLQAKTIAADPRNLSAQKRSLLSHLAQRQNKLSRQFDDFRNQLLQAANQPTANQQATNQQATNQQATNQQAKARPFIAGKLSATLQDIQATGVDATMRSIARSLERNRLGQASSDQQAVIDNLKQLHDIMANRGTRDVAEQPSPTDNQRQLLAELELIRSMQQRIRHETERIEKECAGSTDWDDSLIQRHRELVNQQQQLADLLLGLKNQNERP